MPRPPPIPSTALGVAIQKHRGALKQEEAAQIAGIPRPTLSRLERGTHRPSYDTALALAKWLGWTVERVMEASQEAVLERAAKSTPTSNGVTQ